MTRKEYLIQLKSASLDAKVVKQVENVYGCALPEVVKQILSFSKESVFFDDEWRALSPAEVIDAQEDLHIDFKAAGLIPLFDCGENDFIVYHISEDSLSKYNIVDEIVFKKRPRLEDLLV